VNTAALHVADGEVVLAVPSLRKRWRFFWSVAWTAGAYHCYAASGWMEEVANIEDFWGTGAIETRGAGA
jgi:hypothetical protein